LGNLLSRRKAAGSRIDFTLQVLSCPRRSAAALPPIGVSFEWIANKETPNQNPQASSDGMTTIDSMEEDMRD
jgi:hypothetical protein